jgi:ribosome biogenesis protein Tsr3
VIPHEAVEAALYAFGFSAQNIDERRQAITAALEAAAPHLMAGSHTEYGELARLLLADAYALQSKPGTKEICQHLTDAAIAIDRLSRG